MESLKDKMILITGASSGIGKEIATSLLNFDTRLFIIGRNEVALKQIANERKKKAEVSYASVDLTDDKGLDLFIKNLKKSGIEPDILIHCAGIFHYADISNTSNEILDQAYKVNFRAPFILTRDLLVSIKKKRGQIVFINSIASKYPTPNISAYASNKGALQTFAEVLSKEVNPFGVRVSTVYPSKVDTPMQELVSRLEGSQYTPQDYIGAKTIAEAVLNLISQPSNVEISELIIRPTFSFSV